jgi:hypothetical protein
MPEYAPSGLNPAAVGFIFVMGFLLLVLPRRLAVLPLFAAACYMTMGQVVDVAGLNFSIIRILVLVGWVRLLIRGEFRSIRWNAIDMAMVWWVIASVTIYTVLWRTGGAFIYKSGQAYDAIGLYILFRALIRDVDDVVRLFRMVAILIVPLALLITLEKTTGRNLFAVFGGVPAITLVRDGVLRCQGPFPHSILAGTFVAAMVPFFLALWLQKRGQVLAIVGLLSSTVVTVASGSSGPFITYACGVFGFLLWRFRFRMQMVRRGLLLVLFCLQLVMEAPFWFVIAHMGVFSGSTAYYRAFLIDQTIRHFSEWWLIGTRYEVVWAPLLYDITNMYVRVAFDGGLLSLILFVLILKRCFSGVGRALRQEVHRSVAAQRCIWALGAALFAHSMTFLAVWYWDQNIVNWYALLAMIAAVAAPAHALRKKSELPPVAVETIGEQQPALSPVTS